jgi:hypothetical protein
MPVLAPVTTAVRPVISPMSWTVHALLAFIVHDPDPAAAV